MGFNSLFVLGNPTDGKKKGSEREREFSVDPHPQQWHPTWARRGARWCRAGLGSSGSWGEVLVIGPRSVVCLRKCVFFFITACVCIVFMHANGSMCKKNLLLHIVCSFCFFLGLTFTLTHTNTHTEIVHLNRDHRAGLLTVSRLCSVNERWVGREMME